MHLKGLGVIERIVSILGNPTLCRDPSSDWSEFEAKYGVSLPEDYKSFISAYGPGGIADTIFFHPKAPREDDSLNLGEEVVGSAEGMLEMRSLDPSCVPWPIYPESGWAIPVARTIVGEQILLRPSFDGTNWSVIFDWRHGHHEYSMTFAEFMERALLQTLDPPLFQGYSISEWTYENIGRVV